MMIDIIALVLLALAIFKGYSKGLIVALFTFAGYIIGLVAAIKLSAVVAVYLGANTGMGKQWLPILSFAVVFVGVMILMRLGAKFIEKAAQIVLLGWVNRIGGMLLFVLLYITLFSIVLFYAEQLKVVNADTIRTSVTWPYIRPLGPHAIDLFGKLLPVFKGMFQQLETFFGQVAEKSSQ